MRKTKFYDIPVHEDTRDLIRQAKKKRKAKSFDQLLKKTMTDILDQELL